MSIVKEAKKGVFWTFLQQFSIQGINFLVQILLARLLLPADFGLIAMIAIFVAIGQGLTDSGMSTSLIRGKENTFIDYGTVFITNFCISLVVYLIVFFIAPYISIFYEQPVLTNLLRVYSLVFVINSFTAVQLAKFSKELNFKTQFSFQVPSVLIGAFVGVFLAILGYGVWSIIWLNISQAAIFAISLWFFSSWRPRLVFSRERFHEHFNFGYKLTISSLINTIYLNLYKIIIGKNFSPTNVGYFTQADNLRLFPINQISAVLNKVTFPLFASINNDIKLKAAYKTAMRLVLSISAALMLILILSAFPLFNLLFGERWLSSVPYFQILCIASIFLPVGTYNLNIIKVKGRSDLFLKVEIIKKIIGTIALLISIPFGITAMVWSLCLTNVFFSYLNGYFSGRFINYLLPEQIYDSFRVIFIAIIPALIVFFVRQIWTGLKINSFFDILFVVFLYLFIYIPLVYFFNKELLKDIKMVLKK